VFDSVNGRMYDVLKLHFLIGTPEVVAAGVSPSAVFQAE